MSKMQTIQNAVKNLSCVALLGASCLMTVPLFDITGLSNTANAAGLDEVKVALGGYHDTATMDQLETLVGGADALVPILLQLRTLESPPFVAVRAEKMLLNYAERPEVSAALESDLQSPQFAGLARVISMHIDKVSSARVRSDLARHAVSRAKNDKSFAPYTRSFSSSTDAQVREAARSLDQ